MARGITGNRNDLPEGLDPMIWASEVWKIMDEEGVTQEVAKALVAARWAKAIEHPQRNKMIESPARLK
jgi:hypothetical protein